MNIWENAVITQKGLSLLSKLIEGDMLNITKAETGEGYVTPGLLNQLTAVSNPKQTLSFRTQSYPEEGKCKLPCYLTNAGLATGYTAKQVGVYATDPDDGEILFLIVQSPSDKGTVIPSEAEMPGYSAEWNLYFQYGQASGVTIVVDPTGAITRGEMEVYVKGELNKNKEDMEQYLEGVERELNEKMEESATETSKKIEVIESTIAYFQDKQQIVAKSTDGIAYTATIEGIEALFPGLEITIIPNKESTSEEATLNINNLGARRIYPLFGPKTGEILGSVPENWISDSVPLKLIYEDLYWRAISPGRVNGANIYGSVPVEAGGTGRTGFSEGYYLKGGYDGIEEISTPDMAQDVGLFLFYARDTDDVVAGETPLEYNHFIVVYE